MKTQEYYYSSPWSSISLLISRRKLRLSPVYLLTLLTSALFIILLYREDLSQTQNRRPSKHHNHLHYSSVNTNSLLNQTYLQKKNKSPMKSFYYNYKNTPSKLPFSVGKTERGCDMFEGSWVRDETTRPLYEEWECPYIEPQLTCQEHGRPEKEYQFWRWQPRRCSIPSFNATLMLETLRDKRMMFVGDSLNRGQHLSLVCLLHRVIPDHAKSMETNGPLTVFKAKEYNATVEFYWAPFLLESNSDDAVLHRLSDRIVRRGSINYHGKQWKGADIVVFNTYLWWMTGQTFKTILKGPFDDEVKDIVELSTEGAYRMAMKSMLHWIKKNMDPTKTRVFFTSMSPSHNKSRDWGGEPNGSCYNQTSMIQDPTYWGTDTRRTIMQVIREVFRKSRMPISFLNITQLSSFRKDAHTSIYKRQWNPLTQEQIANPISYADCVHWCLPGLQDTWNELLFAKLFYP